MKDSFVDNAIDWLFEHVVKWFVFVGAIALFVGLPLLGATAGVIVLLGPKAPPKIVLEPDEWQCAQEADVERPVHVMVGKIMTTRQQIERECIQYRRKGE